MRRGRTVVAAAGRRRGGRRDVPPAVRCALAGARCVGATGTIMTALVTTRGPTGSRAAAVARRRATTGPAAVVPTGGGAHAAGTAAAAAAATASPSPAAAASAAAAAPPAAAAPARAAYGEEGNPDIGVDPIGIAESRQEGAEGAVHVGRSESDREAIVQFPE